MRARICKRRDAAVVTIDGNAMTRHASALAVLALLTLQARGPELYGPGVFSTAAWDYFMAWTPDQQDVFFCRASDDFSSFEIFEVQETGGRWTQPSHPRFAEQWSNSDPHVTVDGRRVFFISNRPFPGDTTRTARQSYDIWYADRQADGSWGDAQHLDAVINDPNGNEWSPTIAANGDMYFGSNKPPGGKSDQDIWVSRLVDGVYQPAENLGDSINTAGGEIEPWIAPDESYLIFSGARRADSVGTYDLYIAEQRAGVWQRAHLLPNGINTKYFEFNPSVTPDGRWLFFSSNRKDGKLGDIYRVPMSAVRRARR